MFGRSKFVVSARERVLAICTQPVSGLLRVASLEGVERSALRSSALFHRTRDIFIQRLGCAIYQYDTSLIRWHE